MKNIYDFGRVEYVPAESMRELSFRELCIFLRDLLLDVIKLVVFSIPYLFVSLCHLVTNPVKKSVAGQTVLVTGGGNGIGKQIAIRFASEGCNIAIADIDFHAAEETVKELSEMKVIARAYHVDITDIDQIKKLKIQIERDMPPVDIIVNNAGIVPMISLREGTEKEIERIVQVNVIAPLLVTRTFLPDIIKRRRGHVVGIASMSAIHPMSDAIVYSTTKAAMHNFIISLNEELRQEGNDCIRCTSILPYVVSTRKDINESAHLRFPAVTPSDTATIAVNAILRNELMITIPRFNLWLINLLMLAPFSVQMLVRDYLLNEKGKRLFSEDNKKSNIYVKGNN